MSDTVPSGQDTRRVVTVVFSDMKESTVLGESLDPESLRQLLATYFREMRTVLQRHGGTVEKFIGDAVMAVFGVPRLHEDDALRAVRSAADMQSTIDQLNEQFERTWGVRIQARIGINTGEVLAGGPHRESLVVGDAVNVAARLEQAADPGGILIGDATYRLVRDAVIAEPVSGLALRGKSEPVEAWRVLQVLPGAVGWSRRLDSPLVGRDQELAQLRATFDRAASDRACHVVTVIGSAGVGKSRLTSEFLAGVASESRILSGRCLPYGEGITFWPVVEVLRDAAGVSDRDSPEQARPKILDLVGETSEAPLIGERLAALLGLSGVTPGIQETFWAVRKLFEQLAASRPLVVVFDDIHWGEPTFLDLVEYVADWMRGVPVMVVCLARHELLEVRGAWLTGKPNATLVHLEPLPEEETEGLIGNLLRGGALAGDTGSRIASVAEGNPLFVEEFLKMLIDDGVLRRDNGSWAVEGDLASLSIPPTIHALLSARLDRLKDEERAVIERAAVIGRVFWWGAVSELVPEEQRAGVASGLQSLARKELILPEHSDLGDEDAFRFAHILVRDAAYRGIPKATRAAFHERFADWVAERSRQWAGEYEEIVGFHLEKAHQALQELEGESGRVRALGERAAAQLAVAGRRAFARGDMPASVSLLSRAAALLPAADRARLQILPDLAFALLETGDFARMQAVVEETREGAATSGDPTLQAQAQVLGLWMRVFTDPEGWAEEAFREATQAITAFEDQGDHRGLAKGWSLLGLVHLFSAQFETSEQAWELAAQHAEGPGQERERLEYLSWVPLVVWGGPRPVEDGIRRCREILDRSAGDRKAMSTALFVMGKLEAMRGRFDEARDLVARARAILQEVALTVWLAGPLTQFSGWVDLLAGDPAAAERDLAWGAETLKEIGELSWLSTVAGILAEAVHAQGRFEDVEPYLQMTEETAGSEDVYSQALLRSVRAKMLARERDWDGAVALGREAVAITQPTDFLFIQAFALLTLGELLGRAGRGEEAREVLGRALEVCERKGFTVGADRVRALLDATPASG